jgi:hypothetical protein
MILTRDEIQKYFESRLSRTIPSREKVAVKCPFHDDSTASATVFLTGNGALNCQACGAKGNVFQVEARFSSCTVAEAEQKVAEITGATPSKMGSKGQLDGVYDYRAEDGSVLFQKRKYRGADGKKTFSILRPDGRTGWVSGLDGDSRKVLYNLPSLVTCNLALIAEGEKDCATLDGLNLFLDRPDLHVASTCNFEGAWQPGHSPKWLPQYSPYFVGKGVVIFEDNDESGRTWADHIAGQIEPYACWVRRISFPELPEKGDVTDWMAEHTEEELRKRVVTAPKWTANAEVIQHREVLIPATRFAKYAEDEIDWLVTGVIQRGANGFIAASPKSGKSWCALDMLISLAIGCPWMDFEIARPVRCGYVSREDGANLTAWRLGHLFRGKRGGNPELLEHNLYINSRRETPQFFLDCEEDIQELVFDIKRLSLEFVVLDVFNRLHTADENDNQAMSAIMAQVNKLCALSGASIGIVHHYSKSQEGNMTQRLRGAGAIGGFAEWQIGVWVEEKDRLIRGMEFETKAAEPQESLFFQINTEKLSNTTKIARVEYEPMKAVTRQLRKVD